MNTYFKKRFAPVVFAAMALPAFAGDSTENGPLNDAWLDGKLDTVILLNKHLNPFEIDTDVSNKIAVVTGEVDSEVEKDLVSELAKSIDGIQKVDNRLKIKMMDGEKKNHDQGAMSKLKDASITTAISTKLLLNTEIDSTEINVDTKKQSVVLKGSVESETEKDLVEQIAKNTSDVQSVTNHLKVAMK